MTMTEMVGRLARAVRRSKNLAANNQLADEIVDAQRYAKGDKLFDEVVTLLLAAGHRSGRKMETEFLQSTGQLKRK